MGLILDSSLLIADERGRFDMPASLQRFSGMQPIIAAITASELLHGVEPTVSEGTRFPSGEFQLRLRPTGREPTGLDTQEWRVRTLVFGLEQA